MLQLVEQRYALAPLLELLGVAPQLARLRYVVVQLVELQYVLVLLLELLGVVPRLVEQLNALDLLVAQQYGVVPLGYGCVPALPLDGVLLRYELAQLVEPQYVPVQHVKPLVVVPRLAELPHVLVLPAKLLAVGLLLVVGLVVLLDVELQLVFERVVVDQLVIYFLVELLLPWLVELNAHAQHVEYREL